MVLAAMMAALTAILAQLSIPIGPVPITLSILSVYFAAVLLGSRLGATSILIYIIIGSLGVPVFANFKGGVQVLFGPTGGYLFGYVIATYIIGKGLEQLEGSSISLYKRFIFMSLIGLTAIYIVGTIQLKYVLNIPFLKAYYVGAQPFIILDIIKIFAAGAILLPIRNSLVRANLIQFRSVREDA